MTFVLTEEERRIFDLLRLEGCCLRCCLRFTGCRNAKYYQDLAELEHLVQYSEVNKLYAKGEVLPCIACLGILQPKAEESVIERVSR